jgi:hypothetical protein
MILLGFKPFLCSSRQTSMKPKSAGWSLSDTQNYILKEILMPSLKMWISVFCAVFLLALSTASVHAADNYSDLMNRAGMQRMLSQRIAKAYLYHGQNIAQQEASHQLNIALTRFEYNHTALKGVKDPTMQQLLSMVENHFGRYKDLVNRPYTKENGAMVLTLSETLLRTCQEVVVQLEKISGAHIDQIINLSGRQRMLSQRIAKFYIAYQSGFQDDEIIDSMEEAVADFESAMNVLRAERRNTDRINLLLERVQTLWKRISPYFLKLDDSGNPTLILSNTDDINRLSDEITELYVEVSERGDRR